VAVFSAQPTPNQTKKFQDCLIYKKKLKLAHLPIFGNFECNQLK